jgi:hypothetical protein
MSGFLDALFRTQPASAFVTNVPGQLVDVSQADPPSVAGMAPVTTDTGHVAWTLLTSGGTPTANNKNMSASLTTADGQQACATGITATPSAHSNVSVVVNGTTQNLTGDKTGDCYFSADGGTTARALNAIASGDKLYWNGSIAGFQLATTDRVSFNYVV